MKTNFRLKAIAMLIMLVTIFTMTCAVFETYAAKSPSDISAIDTSGEDSMAKLGGQAISIVTTIGSIAAVIVLIILGLKYMMGSTEEKAEYKKTLMPYVIGAILVFAASAIAGIVYNIGSNISIT